jgi:hypothetical protein
MTTMATDRAKRCLTLIDVIKVDAQRTTELIKHLQGDLRRGHVPPAWVHGSGPSPQPRRQPRGELREMAVARGVGGAVKRDEARARVALTVRLAPVIDLSLFRVELVHGPKRHEPRPPSLPVLSGARPPTDERSRERNADATS